MNATMFANRQRPALWFLFAFLLGGSSGCIIIPTPEHDSGEARRNFNKASPAALDPGTSRFEDVLLIFGEPDAVSADERRLAYRSEKIVGFWIAGGGYSASAGTLTMDRYLLVELDEQGVVQGSRLSSRWFLARTPDQLLQTSGWKTNAVAESNGAIHNGPAFWFQGVDGFQPLALGPGEHARGILELTDTCIRFRDRTQTGDSAPRWQIPYEALSECRLAKYGVGRRVVVRTREHETHSFTFEKNKLNGAAYQLIRSRIVPSEIERSH